MSFRHAATSAALSALCLSVLAARAEPGPPGQRTDIVPANFVDVTSAAGVQFHHYASQTAKKYMLEIMGSGVALFDFDNDGRLDIFLVNGAPISDPTPPGAIPRKSDPKYWHRLYHQKPDGTFEDVTERAGVEGKGYGYGVAVGDYDNDGSKTYLSPNTEATGSTTTTATERLPTSLRKRAWAAAVGPPAPPGWTSITTASSISWSFVTCSGISKTSVCLVNGTLRTYCRPDSFPPIEPLVYHNNGDGTFTEVSRQIGIDKPGKGLGIAIADYDRDGHVNVYVANDSMPGFLYHNKGNGTFEEVALLAGVGVTDSGRTYAGMGVDFADYNNDGLPDLAVADLAFDKYALYENEGNGFFKYATDATGLGNITMQHSGMGLHFIDYDNDGRKDLLVSQGHVMDTVEQVSHNLHYREPILLVRNTPQGFVDVSAASGEVFRQAWAGRGLAIGDINNDGRVDAVVSTSEARPTCC